MRNEGSQREVLVGEIFGEKARQHRRNAFYRLVLKSEATTAAMHDAMLNASDFVAPQVIAMNAVSAVRLEIGIK